MATPMSADVSTERSTPGRVGAIPDPPASRWPEAGRTVIRLRSTAARLAAGLPDEPVRGPEAGPVAPVLEARRKRRDEAIDRAVTTLVAVTDGDLDALDTAIDTTDMPLAAGWRLLLSLTRQRMLDDTPSFEAPSRLAARCVLSATTDEAPTRWEAFDTTTLVQALGHLDTVSADLRRHGAAVNPADARRVILDHLTERFADPG